MQAIALILVFAFLVINLVVDLLYALNRPAGPPRSSERSAMSGVRGTARRFRARGRLLRVVAPAGCGSRGGGARGCSCSPRSSRR